MRTRVWVGGAAAGVALTLLLGGPAQADEVGHVHDDASQEDAGHPPDWTTWGTPGSDSHAEHAGDDHDGAEHDGAEHDGAEHDGAAEHDGDSGHDHSEPAERPRAEVLAGFGGANALVLLTAAALRRHDRTRRRDGSRSR